MLPPRREWGKAIVWVSYTALRAFGGGLVLPRDYEIDMEIGQFFQTPQRMAFGIVVTGPDIPQTEDHVELPNLNADYHTWDKIVVMPYGS